MGKFQCTEILDDKTALGAEFTACACGDKAHHGGLRVRPVESSVNVSDISQETLINDPVTQKMGETFRGFTL